MFVICEVAIQFMYVCTQEFRLQRFNSQISVKSHFRRQYVNVKTNHLYLIPTGNVDFFHKALQSTTLIQFYS
jgi:hypothetical protein